VNAPGHRLQWTDLPDYLRDEINGTIGSPVVEAVGQRGGYGPSLAARCGLADGRRVFIKAVSPAQNPDTPGITRREAHIATCLPPNAPAPALLHTLDDGEWIALVFEEVAGELPQTPWNLDELDRVVDATHRLGELAPCSPLPTLAEHYGDKFNGWRTLASEATVMASDPAIVDEWCAAHLGELADAEARWEQATAGDGLIHGDVRSDNVLLTDHGVMFVDWTSTCTGVNWFEVLAMLPSVELEGGGAPESVLARAGLDQLDINLVVPVLAALAGYFVHNARLPCPRGLPTLRAFQRAQGDVTIAWLRRLWDRD
jgi:aminoglycoside phosphotransferase (APT) family kinase protein